MLLPYLDYAALSANEVSPKARTVLIYSLSYFLFGAFAGFVPGMLLGGWVRSQRWRWTRFFVKHRWMLDLIQIDELTSVSARVVLKDKFAVNNAEGEHPIILEGILSDSYFGADGKLLYLVFSSFVVLQQDGAPTAYLSGLGTLDKPVRRQPGKVADHLVVEGDRIELVRYSRREFPLDELEKKLNERNDQPPTPETESSINPEAPNARQSPEAG